MKAISLWQPWASAIALGLKTIETRSWSTAYRGPLAIHAAVSGLSPNDLRHLAPLLAELDRAAATVAPGWRAHRGAVVATCILADVVRILPGDEVEDNERRWGDFSLGRFAWHLENVKRLEQPAPARGWQGLWEWSVT